jgi:hypothetical protein
VINFAQAGAKFANQIDGWPNSQSVLGKREVVFAWSLHIFCLQLLFKGVEGRVYKNLQLFLLTNYSDLGSPKAKFVQG